MTTNAFWQQGEVQAGRPLPRPLALPTSWEQTILYPPSVVEARLRVGVIASEDHLRWQLEVMDPQDRELLAMEAHPACRLSDLEQELPKMGHRLWTLLGSITNPDPF